MSDELNDSTTQSLQEEMNTRFDRLEALVASLASQVSTLQNTANEIARDQREMYIDLRGRVKIVHDKVDIVQREVREFINDQQPGSLQSRMMR